MALAVLSGSASIPFFLYGLGRVALPTLTNLAGLDLRVLFAAVALYRHKGDILSI